MRTPYMGRVDLGDVEVTVTIANVDTNRWVGEIMEARPAAGFESGAVTVKLLDQPRPGWVASATAEALPDGSGRLIGTGVFVRPRHSEDANRAAYQTDAHREAPSD